MAEYPFSLYNLLQDTQKIPNLKIGVIGGRDFDNYNLLKTVLWKVREHYKFEIICSGGVRKDDKGADTLAERFADEGPFPKMIFPPQINDYGSPKAYFIRNEQIATFSDMLFAFWDGKSTGTLDTLERGFNKHKLSLYHDLNDGIVKIFNRERYDLYK